MRKPLDNTGAILLAAAIINQAADDYTLACARIARLNDRTDRASADKLRAAKRMKSDCERFFRSGWFVALTGESGTQMLDRLSGRCAHDPNRNP